MSDPAQILELLEEALATSRTPEEVCDRAPQLLPEVRMRWERCRQLDLHIADLFPQSPGVDGPRFHAGKIIHELPVIPGYRIDALLGHGGMGVVFKARHLQLNRTVALKMLLSGAHASELERSRFDREARAVAALRHPHVVQIYDVGEFDGRPFFTMEFVDGGSLADKLGGVPTTSMEAASTIAVLADAIENAHRNGVVHRDLKPANVLLTDDATPKISDFGLALVAGNEGLIPLTLSGARIGTPSYMSPEQASGKRQMVGPATDIYALGAILYEMLTGRPPFCGESVAETERQIISDEPVQPTRLNSRVPYDIETICLKCLQKSPSSRYASAQMLADDLRHFLAGEPIAARPTSKFERVVKWVRRRPALAALLIISALLLLSCATGCAWIAVNRATSERVIEASLADVIDAERHSDFKKAQLGLERAEALLINFESKKLRAVAAERRSDLEVVKRIDEIRMLPLTELKAESAQHMTTVDAFRNFARDQGMGVGSSIPTTAAKIANSPLRDAWLAAFDTWAWYSSDGKEVDWVMAVSRTADPDPRGWRDRVRTRASWKSRETLTALVGSASISQQPVLLQILLSYKLRVAGGDAIDYLKKIQKEHPGDYWVNDELCMALMQTSPSEEAVGFARAALAVRPDQAVAHEVLALAVGLIGRTDEEIEEHERALTLNPNLLTAHVNLAIELAKKQKWKECEEHLRRAREIDPTRPNVDVQVGALMYVGNEMDQAKAHFKRAANDEPKSEGPVANLGLVAEQAGETEAAIQYYRHALEINPKDPFPRMRLAYIEELAGNFQKAETLYRQALFEKPNDSNALPALREVMIRQGRVNEVQQDWAKLLATKPRSQSAYYGYAELCLFLGRSDEYVQAKNFLLEQYGTARQPHIAERVARACLLQPCSDADLEKIGNICDVALKAEGTAKQTYSHFQFAKALLEYRRGHFDEAMKLLRGPAVDVLRPAPQIIIAMALHRQGKQAEARRLLDVATKSCEWNETNAVDQDAWIKHVLRREAESLIVPH